MLRLGRGSLTKGLATILSIIGISWLALEYFVPSPPSRITIATGPKGTTFDYFGERYRERFARAGVRIDLRETAGALELQAFAGSKFRRSHCLCDGRHCRPQSGAGAIVDGTHLQCSFLDLLPLW